MQTRIRHLYRAAPENVQRATHAFAAPIEDMSIGHIVISDSVPVGRLQRASKPENLRSWLQKSGCNRYWKYILQRSDFQEKTVPKCVIYGKCNKCIPYTPRQTTPPGSGRWKRWMRKNFRAATDSQQDQGNRIAHIKKGTLTPPRIFTTPPPAAVD